MILTQERRKATGAFYTPRVWAEKAAAWLLDCIGYRGDIREYIFWDCAAGEGSLLEVLPSGIRKIATTLEAEDVALLKNKGFEAYGFDFLNDDLEVLPFWNEVQQKRKRLVIFTNPPYMGLPAGQESLVRDRYKNRDAETLFMYRICLEIDPAWLGIFTKMGTIQVGQRTLYLDTGLFDYFADGFLTYSKDWGLKGNFLIPFSIFEFSEYRYFFQLNRQDRERVYDRLYYCYWAKDSSQVPCIPQEGTGMYNRGFNLYL